MSEAKRSSKRKAKRKNASKKVFSPELALEVISDDFSSGGSVSCIADEAPAPEALKDFGESDRNVARQAEGGTSGRDGFVR